MRFVRGLAILSAVAVLISVAAAAEMRGVTSTEIRIGQTMPYSGPVSAFGALYLCCVHASSSRRMTKGFARVAFSGSRRT